LAKFWHWAHKEDWAAQLALQFGRICKLATEHHVSHALQTFAPPAQRAHIMSHGHLKTKTEPHEIERAHAWALLIPSKIFLAH
jgi:hypothetical protein